MIDKTSGEKQFYFHYKTNHTFRARPTDGAGQTRQFVNHVVENWLELLSIAGQSIAILGGVEYLVGVLKQYSGSSNSTSGVETHTLVAVVSYVASKHLIIHPYGKKLQKLQTEYLGFCKGERRLQTFSEKKKFLAEITTSVEKMTRRQLEYSQQDLTEEQIVRVLITAISEPIYWPYCKRLLQSIIQPTVNNLKDLLFACIKSDYAEGISLLATKGFKWWNTTVFPSQHSFPLCLAYQASSIEVGIELVKKGAKPMTEEIEFSSDDEKKDYEEFVDLVERTIIYRERNKSNAYLILWAHQKCTLNVLPLDIIKYHIIPEVLKV